MACWREICLKWRGLSIVLKNKYLTLLILTEMNFVQDKTNNPQTQTFYFSKKIEDTRQRYQFCFVQTIHQLSQTFSQVFYKHFDDLVFGHSKYNK